MTKLMNGILAGALALSFSTTAVPAKAETLTTVAGVVLLAGAATILRFSQRDNGGTSENTQYALTGQGTPQISAQQEALWNAYRASGN